MRYSKSIGAVVLLLALFSSCKVPKIPEVINYTFINNTGQHVTLDLYNTKEDYTHNANRVSRSRIVPLQSVTLPLAVSTPVWIDWYTDDYSTNNWQMDALNVTGQTVYQLAAETQPPVIDANASLSQYLNYADTTRMVLLNGSDSGSTWQLSYNGSINPDRAGTHRLEVKKDFTCNYTFTNTQGSVQTSTAYYRITKNAPITPTRAYGFTMYLYRDPAYSSIILTADFNTNSSGPQTGPPDRDTLRATLQLPSTSVKLPLVRQ
jgi:hypothetical protein